MLLGWTNEAVKTFEYLMWPAENRVSWYVVLFHCLCICLSVSWFLYPSFISCFRTPVLFVEPLLPLFWTFGNLCPEFQSQGGSLLCVLCHLHAMNSSYSPLVRHLLTSRRPGQHGGWAVFDQRTCIYFYHGFYLFLSLDKRHGPRKTQTFHHCNWH